MTFTAMLRRQVQQSKSVRLLALLLACLATGFAGFAPVLAASPDAIGFQSYITPFPDNDRYRVYVFGDAFAKGLAGSLGQAFAVDSAADVVDKAAWGGGLARVDDLNIGKVLDGIPAADRFHVAVLVFGMDDVIPIRIDKKRFEIDTEPWQQEYAKRVDSLMRAFKRRKIAVYWLGLPIMRGPNARTNSGLINGIIRQKAVLSGARYIDTWSAFADANGNFTPYGPDMTGKNRLLRLDNGIHMTDSGYQKLANFAEREIRRDLAAARAEREIPLAGDLTEQQTVRSESETATTGDGKSAKPGAKNAKSAVPDTPADNATITMAIASTAGSPTNRKIEINRPAIPGAVIAHLRSAPNRALDIGQSLSADLQGGLTALSSITLGSGASDGNKNRLSLTQSPYYKVLVKGEVLQPKPGRSDDFRWPRDAERPAG